GWGGGGYRCRLRVLVVINAGLSESVDDSFRYTFGDDDQGGHMGDLVCPALRVKDKGKLDGTYRSCKANGVLWPMET
ncbi:hypothetical protein B296_00020425, partial [Ensete ventricosum]